MVLRIILYIDRGWRTAETTDKAWWQDNETGLANVTEVKVKSGLFHIAAILAKNYRKVMDKTKIKFWVTKQSDSV